MFPRRLSPLMITVALLGTAACGVDGSRSAPEEREAAMASGSCSKLGKSDLENSKLEAFWGEATPDDLISYSTQTALCYLTDTCTTLLSQIPWNSDAPIVAQGAKTRTFAVKFTPTGIVNQGILDGAQVVGQLRLTSFGARAAVKFELLDADGAPLSVDGMPMAGLGRVQAAALETGEEVLGADPGDLSGRLYLCRNLERAQTLIAGNNMTAINEFVVGDCGGTAVSPLLSFALYTLDRNKEGKPWQKSKWITTCSPRVAPTEVELMLINSADTFNTTPATLGFFDKVSGGVGHGRFLITAIN